MSARDLTGDEDDFLFLARAEVVVPRSRQEVWDRIEGDLQDALLRHLARHYRGRTLIERFADGYRCSTTSKSALRRPQTYESVVWLDEPERSVEVQFGRRTDLRYELRYTASEDGTRVACTQSYRAHSAGFESGAAIARLQQRADEVVRARVDAILALPTRPREA